MIADTEKPDKIWTAGDLRRRGISNKVQAQYRAEGLPWFRVGNARHSG